MNPSPSPNSQASAAAVSARPAVEAIDASCRWPVMFLFVCAVVWLVIGGALSAFASLKAHAPALLADCPWLTYGRVQPAAWHALVYGFASQAALGAALWMTARLSGATLAGGRCIFLATLFWNAGLKLGLWGILAGQGTGFEGLEFPRYTAPMLFLAYAGIAGGGLLTFHQRQAREVYVSQWYVLGALFTFPWVFVATQVLGLVAPPRGVLQVAVHAWYLQNLLALWLGFAGLAILFYLIPKLTGQAVPNRNLAVFGFWALALFGGLGGLTRYQGGPFPAWMTSLSAAATVMTLVPVAAVVMNLLPLRGVPGDAVGSRTALRLARWALAAYVIANVLNSANAFAGTRALTQFTLITPALDQLFICGFAGLALLGVIYHVVPQLMGLPWPAPRWVRLHAVLALAGVGLLVGAGLIGGWLQGAALQNPEVPFVLVVKRYVPFVGVGTLGWLLLLAGGLLLLVNLARVLAGYWRPLCVPAIKALRQPESAEGQA